MAIISVGCGATGGGSGLSGGMGSPTEGEATSTGDTNADGSATAGASESADSSDDSGLKLDVGAPAADTDSGGATLCKVGGEMDAAPPCELQAPPDSFDPVVQWSWSGPFDDTGPTTTPLVANLTDDNGDGEVDLCDIPDVVVMEGGSLFVLDGATGEEHYHIEGLAERTPAIGDVDSDGIPEIVAMWRDGSTGRVAIWEHDGQLKLVGDAAGTANDGLGHFALADLDNDGDVEIYGVGGGGGPNPPLGDSDGVFDHLGALVWKVIANDGGIGYWGAPTAADLDGDGDLEVIFGPSAHHHDGSLYYVAPSINKGTGNFPQVANLDEDSMPEILIANEDGLSVLEHDGTVKYRGLAPTGDPTDNPWIVWMRPAAVHDFDGDGRAEFAVASQNHYSVFESDASILWSADVKDQTGAAGSTAFDFIGAGTAQATYADETRLFVFDGTGQTLVESQRSSTTSMEYPVVADVDNDGSAEIIVVSNEGFDGQSAPDVQVIRDAEDRWVPARRIWNQHTYHVTNVREDGTIPQFEPPSWELLNTFRTQAQVEGNIACQPRPAG